MWNKDLLIIVLLQVVAAVIYFAGFHVEAVTVFVSGMATLMMAMAEEVQSE